MLLLCPLAANLAGTRTGVAPRATHAATSSAGTKLPPAWEPKLNSRAWQSIVLHHSATVGGSVAAIDAEHRTRKDAQGKPWLGIGYHFVIGNGRGMDDGRVEPTFRWTGQLAGAHAGEHRHNETGIGICLVGNFDDGPPTARQLAALKELLLALSGRYALARDQVVRHADFSATQCPGRQFPFRQIVAAIPEIKPGTAPPHIGRSTTSQTPQRTKR